MHDQSCICIKVKLAVCFVMKEGIKKRKVIAFRGSGQYPETSPRCHWTRPPAGSSIALKSASPHPDHRGPGGGRLRFFLPGCVSMGLENKPILKGLNDGNSDPH